MSLNQIIKENEKRWFYKVPFALEFHEWDIFEETIKNKFPIQFFFRNTLPRKYGRLRQRLSDSYYEVRAFFFPYNVLRIPSLPRTWSDRDEVLLHTCFQILIDYVEKEDTWILSDIDKEIEKEEADEYNIGWHRQHKENHLKLRELYFWGKNDLPRLYEITSNMSYKEEQEFEKEITNKLKTLVELRGYLWT